MLRRQALGLAGRLTRQLAGSGAACAAAEGGTLSASAAALQLLDRWQQGSSGGGFSTASAAHPYFHMRFFSSSPLSQDLPDGDVAAAAAAAPVPDLSQVLDPTAIVKAATLAEAAAIAEAGTGLWAPTQGIQSLLVFMQQSFGLEWWAAIALTTVAVRLATFPVMLFQIKNTYKLSQARPEVEKVVEWMKEEQARGNPNVMSEYQQRVSAVWAKYDANPFKSMVSMFVQLPIFVGFFSALRSFAEVKVPSLTTGGALWFQDLTVADPIYMLPVLSSLTFLLTVELGAGDGMEGQPEKTKQRMKMVMRCVALGMIPLTVNMPAGVFCYWAASNTFSLVQSLVLKNQAVKKALGIPDVKTAHLSEQAKMVGKPVVTYAAPPRARPAPRGGGGSRLERALDKAAEKQSR